MDNEKIITLITSVFKDVFKEDVEVTPQDDGFLIQDYWEIRPEGIEVTTTSILGKKTKSVKGWALYVWKTTPYSYWEPQDIDEIFVDNSESVIGIMEILVGVVAQEKADIALEHYHYSKDIV